MTKYKLVFILLSLIILQNEFTKLSAQHYKSVISNFACTTFGNVACTEIGNMACT